MFAGSEAFSLVGKWQALALPDGGFGYLIYNHDTRLLLLEIKGEEELKLPAMRLTTVGLQLIELGEFEPDDHYLRAVAELARKGGIGWAATVGARLLTGHHSGGEFIVTSQERLY